jgi:hypothetical protein
MEKQDFNDRIWQRYLAQGERLRKLEDRYTFFTSLLLLVTGLYVYLFYLYCQIPIK